MENKIPIYAGCSNGICYCTGACKKIIGYREPHALEKEQMETEEFNNNLKPKVEFDWETHNRRGGFTYKEVDSNEKRIDWIGDIEKFRKYHEDYYNKNKIIIDDLNKKASERIKDHEFLCSWKLNDAQKAKIYEDIYQFTKLSNEVLYELWDNKENSSFYYIAKNGVIKEIGSTNYENEKQDLDIDITSYRVHYRGMALFREKHIDYFDKFVEKHKNTIFFRTEQEAKNYLKSLTI